MTAIDFDSLANLLVTRSSFTSPSELHGLLCGQLCGGAVLDTGALLQLLDEQFELTGLGQNDINTLMSLQQQTLAQLRGGDFDFAPILPDDEAQITQRAEAIGLWCQGFLAGFGLVVQGGDLNDEIKNTLQDFVGISRVDFEALDESDPNELNMIEVIEYVRMAAMMFYAELADAPATDGGETDPVLH